MQPLGRNRGAYCGERIHLDAVLKSIDRSAIEHGWLAERLPLDAGGELTFYVRQANEECRRLYVSAGIHGDEPAGPMAILRLLERNDWSSGDSLWLCPCLNPSGFLRNTRENALGVDLNRDYLARKTSEIQVHTAWLASQPRFEMGIHLHEDWESKGFYLFELNPGDLSSRARSTIADVAGVCPIDASETIEGFPAADGIIHPNVKPESRTDWPEAFFMVQEKTKISFTLEAPSDFPLLVRTQSLVTAVTSLLR